MKYIDIHTHMFKCYYSDPIKEIKSCLSAGIEIMLMTTSERTEFQEVSFLAEKFEEVYGVYGIHPNCAKGREDGDFLKQNIGKKAIAVGEIGLDFFYHNAPTKSVQVESFVAQIEVAKNIKKPIVIHCREAFGDTWDIISRPEYDNIHFIFHTFSGNAEEAKLVLSRPNTWISISGVVTFKNAKKTQEMVCSVPLNKLFTETDSPYLTPEPFRGKQNSSSYIRYVYQKIAELKGVSEEEVILNVRKNFKKVFGI